ncbi:MAG TPA: hypothetical protein DCG54_07470 [Anaerolineae bacterium]|jgi:DNA (cytosine-5)-methyltransferase 1|nr:hypothetical protein [Anaerolineae bacterium]
MLPDLLLKQRFLDEYADLFCGSGGISTALSEVARELGKLWHLYAINHWDIAIATHKANHPDVQHYNNDLQDVDPLDVVSGKWLRLLVAAPECTHFSRARGGKPKSKQSRASAKYILRWMRKIYIEDVLIENVPDFLTWGPLYPCTCGAGPKSEDHADGCQFGIAVKERKGEYFNRFIRAIKKLGYTVDWRVLNAANYGDPQTRKRLFIICRKTRPIVWPEQTHHKSSGGMFGDLKPWRTAREIIDWSNKGESISKRKTPLRPNTMRRIIAGLYKYGLRPFLIGHPNTTHDNIHSVDLPLQTITSQSADMALAQPFLIQMDHGGYIHDIDKPIPTITSADAWALASPYIVPLNHGPDLRAYDIDKPLPTITSVDAWGLIQPYLVEYHGGDASRPRVRSVDTPIPTIDTNNRFGLAQPYLVEYHGTGKAFSIDEPLKTITGTDVFGLAWPLVIQHAGKLYLVDIYYRMLTPRELARGQSIPDWYQFVGNREQVVKQIGNAVPRRLAKALIKNLLTS